MSDSCIPSFACSHIRAPLEMALQKELDFIDGMVIPYVCDPTRALSHVWEVNFPDLFNHTLWLPKKLDGNPAKRFLSLEFLRMRERLEAFCGREITDSDLRQSIAIYNRNRELLRELLSMMKQGRIRYADHMAIVKASMMMPKEQNNTLLVKLLQELKQQSEPGGEKESVRISLFGLFCESHSILRHFRESGMQVVDDNFLHGTRYFSHDVDENIDPMEGLVDRHFAKAYLSCFHYSGDEWRKHLIKGIKDSQIEGLICLTPSYCDPLGFDYPVIRQLLQELDIPVLFLEMEFSSGQLRTRIQAFAEILKERKNDSPQC